MTRIVTTDIPKRRLDPSEVGKALGAEPLFTYTFTAWPDETWNFEPVMFDLFRLIGGRCELDRTESGFNNFREGLSRHGITLREVERRPYQPFESIE